MKAFGQTISTVIDDISKINGKGHLGSNDQGKERRIQIVKLIMVFLLSIILVLGALYIILDKASDTENKKWATGVIGVVIGYWIK
jgi:hypothetical protein